MGTIIDNNTNIKYLILLDNEVLKYCDTEVHAKILIKQIKKRIIETLKREYPHAKIWFDNEGSTIRIWKQNLGYIYNGFSVIKHTITYQKCQKAEKISCFSTQSQISKTYKTPIIESYFDKFKKQIPLDKKNFPKIEVQLSNEFKELLDKYGKDSNLNFISDHMLDHNLNHNLDHKFKLIDVMNLFQKNINNKLLSKKIIDSHNRNKKKKYYQIGPELSKMLGVESDTWMCYFEIWVKLFETKHYFLVS